MKVNEYQALARRTSRWAREEDVKIVLAVKGRYGLGSVTAAMGLAGEVMELLSLLHRDPDCTGRQMYDELGDVLWYIAEAATELEVNLSDVLFSDDWRASLQHAVAFRSGLKVDDRLRRGQDPVIDLAIAAGRYLDYRKKGLEQGWAMNTVDCLSLLQEVGYWWVLSCLWLGGPDLEQLTEDSLEAVAKANVAKLKARYPEGFSVEDSVNRT